MVHEPLSCLVFEIFSIKVVDTQTDTSTDNDNKGRLKPAVHEQIQYVGTLID